LAVFDVGGSQLGQAGLVARAAILQQPRIEANFGYKYVDG